MLRTFSLGVVAMSLVACGSSTTSNEGTTPGVESLPSESDTTTSVDTTLSTALSTTVSTDVPVDTGPATSGTDTTAAPTTAPTVESTAATTTPPATDPSTPATTQATSGTAVAYGGGGGRPFAPLAWWDGSTWNAAGYVGGGDFVNPPAPTVGAVAATSLDLADGPGQVVDGLSLGEMQYYCVGDEQGPVISGIETPVTDLSLGYDVLAVTADWPVQPRAVRQVGEDDPDYAAIGAELMSDLATGADGQVVQAVRADLDGDGLEEVLVTYERITDVAVGAGGDFSLIFLRVPEADGSVENVVIEKYVQEAQEDLESPYPTVGRYSVAAIADANGDGVMEFATRYQFFESGGMVLYDFGSGAPIEIGSGGCGV